MHRLSKPHWETFEEHHAAFFPCKTGAPTCPPSDEQLYFQAQRATADTNAGMDGWKPYELKLLPKYAWTKRRQLLCLSRKVHTSPQPYYTLASPALSKEDKLKPSSGEQKTIGDVSRCRLLSLFVSLYRIESGATYRQHQAWLETWIHPSLYACLPGRECLDASWDT
jgi:hypothetical protein